ncbi:hypothetical protein A3Q56_04530 [Intoshia linei]|uniref:Uncharacterized protein n=1 Tax=Intoshia linei TaxID=1819745 RepID=A0A177B2U2_9BILA|nr:hypothetical protein A3Q56_04530 [Intoshia linei]
MSKLKKGYRLKSEYSGQIHSVNKAYDVKCMVNNVVNFRNCENVISKIENGQKMYLLNLHKLYIKRKEFYRQVVKRRQNNIYKNKLAQFSNILINLPEKIIHSPEKSNISVYSKHEENENACTQVKVKINIDEVKPKKLECEDSENAKELTSNRERSNAMSCSIFVRSLRRSTINVPALNIKKPKRKVFLNNKDDQEKSKLEKMIKEKAFSRKKMLQRSKSRGKFKGDFKLQKLIQEIRLYRKYNDAKRHAILNAEKPIVYLRKQPQYDVSLDETIHNALAKRTTVQQSSCQFKRKDFKIPTNFDAYNYDKAKLLEKERLKDGQFKLKNFYAKYKAPLSKLDQIKLRNNEYLKDKLKLEPKDNKKSKLPQIIKKKSILFKVSDVFQRYQTNKYFSVIKPVDATSALFANAKQSHYLRV